jgi:arsenate reductase-like glutaredoxin family protein
LRELGLEVEEINFAKTPNVMRRPILVLGKKVLVGFDKSNKDLWAKLG